MLHYHGTPISPIAKLYELAGRNFCISYAKPQDCERAHEIGQSVMLDNGAFTFWRQGVATSQEWWTRFAGWAEPWLDYPTTWVVIPDVIDGSEEENDALIASWPRHLFKQSAPVWHMHESLERLKYLTLAWDRVCIGSSGLYADPASNSWQHRMDEVWNSLCPNGGKAPWVHMLRAMQQAVEGPWPFASADSTNAGQNHHRHDSPLVIASRLDSQQAPPRWSPRAQLDLAL
jgi:hypothetical protein